MLISLEVPLLVKEYLESRFGEPVAIPKTASVNIGIKIAICSGICLDSIAAHSSENKVSLLLSTSENLFNKKPIDIPKAAQRQVIAQQLHQYVLEQVSLEVAIISCTRKKSIDQAINSLIKKHSLSTDSDNIKTIFKRRKRALDFSREITPLTKIN